MLIIEIAHCVIVLYVTIINIRNAVVYVYEYNTSNILFYAYSISTRCVQYDDFVTSAVVHRLCVYVAA